jgi:hypothetical protein
LLFTIDAMKNPDVVHDEIFKIIQDKYWKIGHFLLFGKECLPKIYLFNIFFYGWKINYIWRLE